MAILAMRLRAIPDRGPLGLALKAGVRTAETATCLSADKCDKEQCNAVGEAAQDSWP